MKESTYTARELGENGFIEYTEQENETWAQLVDTQLQLLPERACQEYLDGIEQLAFPHDRVPQLDEISKVLHKATGWQVERVPALINFDRFFELLSEKKFPVATFIRRPEDIGYLQEPDIFHEIFGHCPMLTNLEFASFTHTYGKLGKSATHEQRVFLARLYWFTVEFGLIDTPDGFRVYGGGILSSPKETKWATGIAPRKERFDPVLALRTPYRIDILQPLYYVIGSMHELHSLGGQDIMLMVAEAKQTGLLPPLFTRD
ncbi:phenylalanine 4-monooxygenase [Sansalvadorimonas sp. 2012CJ34-2]|uniref:Phenylalanine-4-hydroxylase n=1 Tax=Parendozoicomonas callyspongiae TaxID=2942213 RepID=A0ABT0PAT5_9GAMM|nr:phenylalanine 4-monooxygenase [Sansalvadorimonas sp. 2012CJ34-2]MCL6268504.1 phenylalanine 4-monooxygenase [Sansalvadorimonas sp. 2012CJ34-2]